MMRNKSRVLKRAALVLVVLLVAYFITAIILVKSNEPTFGPQLSRAMTPRQRADMAFDQVYQSEDHRFRMRDGTQLFAQYFRNNSSLTVIIIHGIGANGMTYNQQAGKVRDALNAEVYAIDLRGHGKSEGRPGDVDYINQYADDIIDIIRAIRKEKPNEKILLIGHSMGGGIAIRYAMTKDKPLIDGYVLFAPLLGTDSPTMPFGSSDGSEETEEPFMKIHIPRMIGLAMFNMFKISTYNNLPVLFLNQPSSQLKAYSFRSMASMTTRDYKAGLKAIDKPLLVIVGSNDEAFVSGAYKPAIEDNSEGKVVMIEGETHNGIRQNEKAIESLRNWILKKNKILSLAKWVKNEI